MDTGTETKLERIQEIVFRMMCDIDDYCKENNITYYLSGGSCLGAIRHKGFIPWDDDADLMFPREDYERFLEGFEKYFKGKYKVGSIYNDPTWSQPCSVVWELNNKIEFKKKKYKSKGLMVDILPIDGLPNSSFLRSIYYKKLKVLNVIRNIKLRNGYGNDEKYIYLKKLLAFFSRFINANQVCKRMNCLARKHPFNASKFAGVSLAVHYWEKETMTQECFSSAILVPFKDRLFPVPVGYDEYLSKLYGNYMVVPDEDSGVRNTHLNDWNITFKDE